jgi:hypothetical protein
MTSLQLFYADNGAIGDNDPARVQSLADVFKGRFERVGLEMNDKIQGNDSRRGEGSKDAVEGSI